jgi:hypothetical protein
MICYVESHELGYSQIESRRSVNLRVAGVNRAIKRAESVFQENLKSIKVFSSLGE